MHFSQIKKNCEYCCKVLMLNNRRDILRKRFCSRSCNGAATAASRDAEFIERFQRSGSTPEANIKKGKKGKAHPRWKGGKISKICLLCGTPFTVSRCKVRDGCGKYCSKKCSAAFRRSTGMCRMPRKKFTCQMCHRLFTTKRSTEINHGKIRRFCSPRCVNLYRVSLVRRINTKIEMAVESLLLALKVPYEKQKPLLGITIADFFVPPNLVIYADGDYWHGLPAVRKRDLQIGLRLCAVGYRVLRFSESTIYEKINNVKKELSDACSKP